MDLDRIIDRTLEHEGPYSCDPADPGGETAWGICKRQFPELDIKNLKRSDAVEIYIKRYWRPMHLELLKSQRVAWKLFDTGVNMGTGTAIRFLQRVVGADEDGVMGEDTAARANDKEEGIILFGLVKEQALRYCDIVTKNKSQLVFLRGWMKRAFDVGEDL